MSQDNPNDLQDRIKAAREDFKEEYQPPSKAAEDNGIQGANIGYEFLAYVISGGLVGYGIDYFFKTLPWGMIIFIVLGFVAGVFRANERMKNLN